MKKSLVFVLALALLLTAVSAFAEPLQIEYWSVFTGGDGATMQQMVDAINAYLDQKEANAAAQG